MLSQQEITEAIEIGAASLTFGGRVECEINRLNLAIANLESQLAAEASAVEVLNQHRALGRRVTVSVEVYDTKGTSKRGHAATFAEAVEQVKAMLEKSE